MSLLQRLIPPIAATAALILTKRRNRASQVENGNGTDKETVRARPDRPDPPADRSDICARTPEVQTALLNALNSTSCQSAGTPELYRIQRLEIQAEYITNQDLSGLYNLKNLSLTLVAPPPEEAFRDLRSLKALEVNFNSDEAEKSIPWPIGKNTLKGLESLETLSIIDLTRHSRSAGTPIVHLRNDAFSRTENLMTLIVRAGNIYADPESLHRLTRLTDLEMQAEGRTGPFNETGTPTRIPPARLHLGVDAFKTLSSLRRLELGAVGYFPGPLNLAGSPELRILLLEQFTQTATVDLASYRVVCTIGSIKGGHYLAEQETWRNHQLTVGDIPATVINRPHDAQPCRIGIGKPVNGEYPEETDALPLPPE